MIGRGDSNSINVFAVKNFPSIGVSLNRGSIFNLILAFELLKVLTNALLIRVA